MYVSVAMTVLAIALVPVFASQESIINTVQQLYGLLSMPILSAFIVGLAFRNVSAWAAILGVVTGVVAYAVFSFKLYRYVGVSPSEGLGASLASVHYIHYMFVTLVVSIGTALLTNLIIFGRNAELTIGRSAPAAARNGLASPRAVPLPAPLGPRRAAGTRQTTGYANPLLSDAAAGHGNTAGSRE